MTEVTHLPRLSPAAERMRRYRKVQLRRSDADASDFQQAKSANGKPQFLQIVAEPDTVTRGESKRPK